MLTARRWMQPREQWPRIGGDDDDAGKKRFLELVDERSGGCLGARLRQQQRASVGQPKPVIEQTAAFGIFVKAHGEQLAAARRRPPIPGTSLAWSEPTIGAAIPESADARLGRATLVGVVVGNYPGNGHWQTPKHLRANFDAPKGAHPSLRLLARPGSLKAQLVDAAMALDGSTDYAAEQRSARSVPASGLPGGGIRNPTLDLTGQMFADGTMADSVGPSDKNKARRRPSNRHCMAGRMQQLEERWAEHACRVETGAAFGAVGCSRCLSGPFGFPRGCVCQIHHEGWKSDSEELLTKLVTDGDAASLTFVAPKQFGVLEKVVRKLLASGVLSRVEELPRQAANEVATAVLHGAFPGLLKDEVTLAGAGAGPIGLLMWERAKDGRVSVATNGRHFTGPVFSVFRLKDPAERQTVRRAFDLATVVTALIGLDVEYAAPVARMVGDDIKDVVETFLGQPITPPVGGEPLRYSTLQNILGQYGVVNGKKHRANVAAVYAARDDTDALSALKAKMGDKQYTAATSSAAHASNVAAVCAARDDTDALNALKAKMGDKQYTAATSSAAAIDKLAAKHHNDAVNVTNRLVIQLVGPTRKPIVFAAQIEETSPFVELRLSHVVALTGAAVWKEPKPAEPPTEGNSRCAKCGQQYRKGQTRGHKKNCGRKVAVVWADRDCASEKRVRIRLSGSVVRTPQGVQWTPSSQHSEIMAKNGIEVLSVTQSADGIDT